MNIISVEEFSHICHYRVKFWTTVICIVCVVSSVLCVAGCEFGLARVLRSGIRVLSRGMVQTRMEARTDSM